MGEFGEYTTVAASAHVDVFICLLCSRTFQRFAVRSNEWFTEMAKKSESGLPPSPQSAAVSLALIGSCVHKRVFLWLSGAEQQNKIGEKAQSFQKEFREQVGHLFLLAVVETMSGSGMISKAVVAVAVVA